MTLILILSIIGILNMMALLVVLFCGLPGCCPTAVPAAGHLIRVSDGLAVMAQ